MRVYRIEHNKTGIGPFQSCDAKPKHFETVPSPWSDKVFGKDVDKLSSSDLDEFKFGFQSKDLLKKFFTKSDIKALRKKKYKLMEYEIPWHLVYEGDNQCAFKTKEAYKKRSLPVDRVYH